MNSECSMPRWRSNISKTSFEETLPVIYLPECVPILSWGEKYWRYIVKWGFLLLLCFSYRGSLLCAFNFTKAFFCSKTTILEGRKSAKTQLLLLIHHLSIHQLHIPTFEKKNSSIFTTFLYNYIPIHSAMQYDLHFSHHQEGRA